MKKILIITGRYLPGHKDGGPLRTIVNVTEALGDEYDFHIICLDRDHGDTEAYSNIKRNQWNQVGKAKVWYVSPGGFTNKVILEVSNGMDLIYLCSFYDDYGYKTLLLKRQGKINCPVAVASMGVFSKGAISQKAFKKKLFILGCKYLGLFKDIMWSATSELEVSDIKREIGVNIKYTIAEDLPRSIIPGYKKRQDTFSVAFLSRICPKKNLFGAIQILKNVKATVNFYIYGPAEDKEYWEKCKKELETLPENIQWVYQGDVVSEEVQLKLSDHDVFLFPTLGENYGHVIFEALSVGCIPVISDQTPWEEIKSRDAGFVFPLNQQQYFSDAIDNLAKMSCCEKAKMAKNAVQIAIDKVEKNRKETGYRKIFG